MSFNGIDDLCDMKCDLGCPFTARHYRDYNCLFMKAGSKAQFGVMWETNSSKIIWLFELDLEFGGYAHKFLFHGSSIKNSWGVWNNTMW